MLKIFFAGADGFAVPVLEKLLASADINIELVITRPAKPAGRGLKPEPNPVLSCAHRHKLSVAMVDKYADWEPVNTQIAAQKPDFCVVVALGRLVPTSTLSHLPDRFINIHPSFLPKYRGPSPIETALLDGATATAVSFMILTPEMDAGPILKQFSHPIKPATDAAELSFELSELAASRISNVLEGYSRLTPSPQKEHQATYTRILTKADGRVLPADKPTDIDRKIRAFTPWPGVSLEIDGQIFKLAKTHIEKGRLVVDAIQPAGKRVLTAREFTNGYRKLLTKLPKKVMISPIRTNPATVKSPKESR